MPANERRKYTQVIDYVVDQVGADVDRDLLKVAIGAQDSSEALNQNIKSIGGTDQSGADLMAILETTAADDEMRARMFARDASGGLVPVEADTLGSALSGDESAVVTKLAEALESVGNGEMRSTMYGADSTGDPAQVRVEEVGSSLVGNETAVVTAVARALDEVGGTELRSVVYGEDDDGDLQASQVAGLDAEVAPDSTAQLSYLARALYSHTQDELVTRTRSDAAARFSHDDGYVRDGESWHIRAGDQWEAGEVEVDGTLAVDGRINAAEDVTGEGRVTGDGTIRLVEY